MYYLTTTDKFLHGGARSYAQARTGPVVSSCSGQPIHNKLSWSVGLSGPKWQSYCLPLVAR